MWLRHLHFEIWGSMEYYRPHTRLLQGDSHPIVRPVGDREQCGESQAGRCHSPQKWTMAVGERTVAEEEEVVVVVVSGEA